MLSGFLCPYLYAGGSAPSVNTLYCLFSLRLLSHFAGVLAAAITRVLHGRGGISTACHRLGSSEGAGS